jgi:LCP family protein required for cell wall assembly
VWPGLGQLYNGRRRLAVVFAVPAVLVLLLLIYELRRGVLVFGAQFVESGFALGALFIVLLLGVWRVVAVTHAFLTGEPLKTRRTFERAVLVALAVIIVASHTAAGYVLWVSYQAGSQAFSTNNDLIDTATPGPSLAPGETPGPTDEPLATPAIGGRVTILFTGVDAAPSRGEHLYDSIMVVSYNPTTNSVQMVSVPRDSTFYPLYWGGTGTIKINSLPTYVRNGWIKSPDAPYTTLVKEISYLVGITINYYAVMDLGGFVKMIDKVGGIDVNNPSVISDGTYDWLGAKTGNGFYLSAGPHHLDGIDALAYVRSRHGADNSDWARASRQQEVLVDLLHKMAQPSQVLALPDLISTLGSSVSTNFPANKVADYVSLGLAVPKESFKQVVLGPPYSLANATPDGASTSCLYMDKVAGLSIQLFGQDSLYNGKPLPRDTCP